MTMHSWTETETVRQTLSLTCSTSPKRLSAGVTGVLCVLWWLAGRCALENLTMSGKGAAPRLTGLLCRVAGGESSMDPHAVVIQITRQQATPRNCKIHVTIKG